MADIKRQINKFMLADHYFREELLDQMNKDTERYMEVYRCDWPTEPRPEPSEEDIL